LGIRIVKLTPSYASLVPVHYLHVRYMAQLCNLPPVGTPPAPPSRGPSLLPGVSPEALQSKLVKADLTGAQLSVRAARNAALVGLSGIVVEETAGSIRLVGADSRVRVVPKVGSQFTLRFPAYSPAATPGVEADMAAHIAACPQIELDILGTAFAFRSGDRAGRKFRPAQGGGGGSGWCEDYVEAEWSDVLAKVHEGEDLRMVLNKRRKRGKSRRKDPLVQGSLQVF
jgi:ribonuclease P protein subunit POP4